MKTGYYLWKKIDNDIIDKFGPDGISNLIKKYLIKQLNFKVAIYISTPLLC